MIFGFALASNDFRDRLKSVFSCAAGGASSASSAGAAAGVDEAGAAEKAERGVSGMLRRVCGGNRLVEAGFLVD